MTAFRRLAFASVAATFLLVTIGGLVRATDSGLGCSMDWPGCNGKLVPDLSRAEVAIEFSHRVLAMGVGFMIAALAIMALVRFRRSPRLLWPTLAAAGLVLVQAYLGRVVVKTELKADLVVLHLGTALALVALLVLVAVTAAASEGGLADERPDAGVSRSASFAAGSVLALLLVGSYLSGLGEARNAGFPQWPLIEGRLIPDLSSSVIALHWIHRLLAALVAVVVSVVVMRVIRRRTELPTAARFAHWVAALFALEIVVGAANVWTQSSPDVNAAFVTLHLALGAAIWTAIVGLIATTAPAARAVEPAARRERTPALEGSV